MKNNTTKMKNILILGAGTAGTMMANHLEKELDKNEWKISIIDERKNHYYQPGFLFLPFDIYTPEQLIEPIQKYIPKNVNFINSSIEKIEAEKNFVKTVDGKEYHYDLLIIATGASLAPGEVQGMKSTEWGRSVFEFYSFEGSLALRNKLREWKGGRLVVHITEMPIKCPVAPLEFAFLADSYFKNKGMRDKVDITYVTP